MLGVLGKHYHELGGIWWACDMQVTQIQKVQAAAHSGVFLFEDTIENESFLVKIQSKSRKANSPNMHCKN